MPRLCAKSFALESDVLPEQLATASKSVVTHSGKVDAVRQRLHVFAQRVQGEHCWVNKGQKLRVLGQRQLAEAVCSMAYQTPSWRAEGYLGLGKATHDPTKAAPNPDPAVQRARDRCQGSRSKVGIHPPESTPMHRQMSRVQSWMRARNSTIQLHRS